MTENRKAKPAKAPARAAWLSLLCTICLAIPSFNIIDIFPDFIAYFIIAAIFGKYSELAPYFAEAKESFNRLGIVAALKIPALILMIMTIGFGGDSIALFTLIFTATELMLLFPAISNAFSALFYLGEREDCPAAIADFGKGKGPDDVRRLSYVFALARSVLNFIPDVFLLTRATDTPAEMITALKMRMAFPIATFLCMAASLTLGIVWAVMLRKYVYAIAKEGKLKDAAIKIAGEARLAEIADERYVRRILRALTLLILSSVLCFDITFSGLNNGVNVLPHCLFALLIIGVGQIASRDARAKQMLLVSGILYSAISVVAHSLLARFAKEYYYSDLGSVRAADTAYLYFKIASVLELVALVFFIAVYARIIVSFILKHTTLNISDERRSRIDAEMTRKMKIKGYIFAYFPLFIGALKCVEGFLRAKVRYILPQTTSEASVSTIVTSVAPWFGFVILGFTVFYAFYAYYFIGTVKDEVKLKYSNEKQSFE